MCRIMKKARLNAVVKKVRWENIAKSVQSPAKKCMRSTSESY